MAVRICQSRLAQSEAAVQTLRWLRPSGRSMLKRFQVQSVQMEAAYALVQSNACVDLTIQSFKVQSDRAASTTVSIFNSFHR
jgi:hypothetical protein